jgi:methyl-accepting chemotaxis protein
MANDLLTKLRQKQPYQTHTIVLLEPNMSSTENSSPNNIAKIIDLFDFDSDLQQNCQRIQETIGDDFHNQAEEYWQFWANTVHVPDLQDDQKIAAAAKRTEKYLCDKFGDIRNTAWTSALNFQIRDAYSRQIPLFQILAASAKSSRLSIRSLLNQQGIENDEVVSMAEAMLVTAAIETALMANCFIDQATETRISKSQAHSDQFESDIGDTANEMADQTSLLRLQAMRSSELVNGMLNRTSEVASASEQSASRWIDSRN